MPTLGAAADSDQHTDKSHDGLATAYITLQQAVHLPARTQVFKNLANHPLLSVGQVEGKMVLVKLVYVPGVTEDLPGRLARFGKLEL